MIDLDNIITATFILWVQIFLDNRDWEWKHTLEWLSKRKK